MSRIHDMGGRFGDGPVVPGAANDLVFKEDWHGRALAVTLAAGGLGQWNLDVSRHARESLEPADYMGFSYYEIWLAGLADLLADNGVVSVEELAGGDAAASTLAARRLSAEAVPGVLAKGGPADRDSNVAQDFKPGDAVRTLARPGNTFVPGGHTRLPAYAAGAAGRVLRCHGCHVFPDANAHGLGERPEPLYSVAFPASELWDAPEHPDDEVMLDLWQSYLEPA
jgi:nitrile hydratase